MIDETEAGAVLAELERQRLRRRPVDPSGAGCTVAIVALLTAVLTPFAGRAFALSGAAMLAIGGGMAALALVSGLVGLFGGGRVHGAVAAAVEASVQVLAAEYPEGHPERWRAAAVHLLADALVPTPRGTVPTFDPEQVGPRLGPALAYVEDVERFLVERGEVEPVFTAERSGE